MKAKIKTDVFNSFDEKMLSKNDVVTVVHDCETFVVCYPEYYPTWVYVQKSDVEMLLD